MVVYNSLTDRDETGALIPEEVSKEIIQGVPEASAVMSLGRKVPNMSRKQQRLPVLSTLPTAYFVSSDSGLKQTTEMAWRNKYLNAEELAVIVPIPENVIDDTDYPIWEQVKPRIIEAIGIAFDKAVILGTNRPTTWPYGLSTLCSTTGNTKVISATEDATDLYDDIMGVGGLVSFVEEDGFAVNGHTCALGMRARLRGVRDANGGPIFKSDMQGPTRYGLDGEPAFFPKTGLFNSTTVLDICGDWSQLIWTARQDLQFKVFTEGVISDADGVVVLNLMQQDCIALRVTVRLAWQIPNPLNRVNTTSDSLDTSITADTYTDGARFPFARLTTE